MEADVLMALVFVAAPLAAVAHLAIDRAAPNLRLTREGTALTLWAASFMAWALVSGLHGHSYDDYLAEWRVIIAGQDPWRPGGDVPFNAYGPLFNALALLVVLNPLAPKLLFCGAYAVFMAWLFLSHSDEDGSMPPWLMPLALLHPLVWVSLPHFGFFDALVGMTIAGAVHASSRKRLALSGGLLAVGILLKFLPIVALPFLASRGGKVRWVQVLTCLAIAGLGFGASVAIWGSSTFDPLLFAGSRPAVFSPYNLFGLTTQLLHSAIGATVAAAGLGLLLLATVAGRIDPVAAVVAAIMITLLSYRSGYDNYQMMAFVPLIYWLKSGAGGSHGVKTSMTLWLLAIAMIECGFPIVRRLTSEEGASRFLSSALLARWVAQAWLTAAIVAAGSLRTGCGAIRRVEAS